MSKAPEDIVKLDPNFAAAGAGDGLHWVDARRLGLEGQGWTDTAHPYDRFPARAESLVPPNVWSLSHHTAGMSVRFVTTAAKIAVRWRLRLEPLAMHHMPSTGMSGLDLYARVDGKWIWTANAFPESSQTDRVLLDEPTPSEPREYLLYLPLYNGVDELTIGLSEEADLRKAPAWPSKPIVFYGTSITQGGCASRPGMAYTAIVARRLDRPHFNFGFSGNGRMEPEIAELLAELDAAIYVLDAFPNMSLDLIRERLAPFVRILRERRPDTPIVVMENLHCTDSVLVTSKRRKYQDKNEAAREGLATLRAEGIRNLTTVPGEILLGDDREGTIDGGHPNDHGFMQMANALLPILRPLL